MKAEVMNEDVDGKCRLLQISGPLNDFGNSLMVDARTAKTIAIILGTAYGAWGLYKIYVAWNNGGNDIPQKLM